MWYILEVLSKKYHYLLFLLLEVIAFALFFRGNSYQRSVWLSSANAVSGFCYELTSSITSYFSLRQTNSQLSARNVRLEEELAALRQRLARNPIDTAGILSTISADYRMIDAHVVQNSLSKKDNLITIDKGAADGVRRNMGVVSGQGVVGIVYLVGQRYSVVIPILNTHSNISCSIRNRGYFGYISWTGGDARYAYMEDVPRYAHYRRGEIVQTSGFSSIFPPGLTIGKILHTYNSPDGLSYRVKVELATDFARLYDVCVVDNTNVQEQAEVLRAAQDSLANKRR